ncbi:hypothetical protein AB0392_21555 [Nonomuraea angiospora]|uniref:hypothetical protein n=1 Tax=Nonomuraea angiospora TaxID=46172 RepID=UPI00344EAD24
MAWRSGAVRGGATYGGAFELRTAVRRRAKALRLSAVSASGTRVPWGRVSG